MQAGHNNPTNLCSKSVHESAVIGLEFLVGSILDNPTAAMKWDSGLVDMIKN